MLRWAAGAVGASASLLALSSFSPASSGGDGTPSPWSSETLSNSSTTTTASPFFSLLKVDAVHASTLGGGGGATEQSFNAHLPSTLRAKPYFNSIKQSRSLLSNLRILVIDPQGIVTRTFKSAPEFSFSLTNGSVVSLVGQIGETSIIEAVDEANQWSEANKLQLKIMVRGEVAWGAIPRWIGGKQPYQRLDAQDQHKPHLVVLVTSAPVLPPHYAWLADRCQKEDVEVITWNPYTSTLNVIESAAENALVTALLDTKYREVYEEGVQDERASKLREINSLASQLRAATSMITQQERELAALRTAQVSAANRQSPMQDQRPPPYSPSYTPPPSYSSVSAPSAPDGRMDVSEVAAFKCPLTLTTMSEPVVAPSGHSFERRALLSHIRTHHVNPLTGESLSEGAVYRNRALEDAIRAWRTGRN